MALASHIGRDEIVRLASIATGDAKHEASSYSTLDVLAVLYGRVLRFRPAEPRWEERDRFILSKGHGPAAFYATLCYHGFFPEDWMSRFMMQGGRLGGHPDRLLVPGVEASTGSLGHGLPLAVGVALGLRAKRLAQPRVFVLTGDAELNEGTNWEAMLLATHLSLDNLTLIVIDNRSSTLSLRPLSGKLESFGWEAATIDGRDHTAIEQAARARQAGRPTAVIAEVGQG